MTTIRLRERTPEERAAYLAAHGCAPDGTPLAPAPAAEPAQAAAEPAELDGLHGYLLSMASRVGVEDGAVIRGWARAIASFARPAQAAAVSEIDAYRKALHYVAFALHGTPQHMLAKGISLYDNDRVSVKIADIDVDTGRVADPFAPFDAAKAARANL